ncbi:hypothetical protein DRE_03952 [Drechslerella stenobrocha 248]|uniref:Karyogamy protein n=1 Tax=Drechslerella stenobrocha 248 TaxID=1043628 RepID=W7I2R2_9PEZI|nr:hypothetical protein DRE_03952 [Drechslerella stenobrocha 248]
MSYHSEAVSAWSDTRSSSYYRSNGHRDKNDGMNTPPPPPPKDGIPDTLTPPSSAAFDSPSLRVSQYDDDEGDDFQRYLAQSYREQEEQQPGTDERDAGNDDDEYTLGADGHGLHRAPSIYSLSRTSFAAQLSRLTSLSMPLGTDLRSEISSLPSARAAIDKLNAAYSQMNRWMRTAKTVLQGMDASDDVEWAAEGRKSLADVEAAMRRFEGLVKVYVDIIESIQDRPDISSVDPPSLKAVIDQMDLVVSQWKDVQDMLASVKAQVETAMEWTELWNSIMNDIQAELDACINCVFECEEKRYRVHAQENVDIDKLASIVEADGPRLNSKPSPEREDMSSALLGLFARMQPLRASLDFLPMRISQFEYRAAEVFPTACEDLEMRREQLEKKWKALEKDADVLKKELGEDKWVVIFRNAGKQASTMMESVERTINKVKTRTQGAANIAADSTLLKLVENYETKRTHYGSAIERVLSIVNKGMQDRLTVNGEIIRLHADLQAQWKALEKEMQEVDTRLASVDLSEFQDTLPTLASASVSTLPDDLSSTSSVTSGTYNQNGNPALGIYSKRQLVPAATPPSAGSRLPRLRSVSASASIKSHLPLPYSPVATPNVAATKARRAPGAPALTTPKTNPSLLSPTNSRGSSPSLTSRRLSYQTPPYRPSLSQKTSNPGSSDGKPRWNGSTNTSGNGFGHNFKPLPPGTPSPNRRDSLLTPSSATSATRQFPKSADSSPLAFRPAPPAGKKYPPVSMKHKVSHDSISSTSSGARLAKVEPGPGHGKAYTHVQSSGYGRASSSLGNNVVSKIPVPAGVPAIIDHFEDAARSEIPALAKVRPLPASKRFSMPVITKKSGSIDLRPTARK